MSIETFTAEEWLGVTVLPVASTKAMVEAVKSKAVQKWPGTVLSCSLANRWPGHDPRADLDAEYSIIEVSIWKRIVEHVCDPSTEIAYTTIPAEVRANRNPGDPWYIVLAHVLFVEEGLQV